MKEYNFEYFNQKYTQKLVGVLFLTFFILFFGAIFLSAHFLIRNKLILILFFLVAVTIPVLIFQLHKKKIKKKGSAILCESFVEFKLDNIATKLNFVDIETYLVQHYNGALLHVKLKNGNKFNIASNNTYCNTSEFETLCVEFENKIENFDTKNFEIIRRKTFFEKIWMRPFLLILTTALVFMIAFVLLTNRRIPISSILIAIGSLSTLWIGYLGTRRKGKN